MKESSTRPVVLLASTGFILRDIAFGAFGRTVLAQRPLVIAVHEPDDPETVLQAAEIGATLIGFPRHEIRSSSRRSGQVASVHHWMYRLGEARKSTESIRTQTRLFESGRSRNFNRLVRVQRRISAVVHNLGLTRTLEDLYLRLLVRRPPYRSYWTETLADLDPAIVVATMLTHSTVWAPSEDLGVAVAAHRMGIPVGSLVQSWDNLTSKTAILPVWIDRHWTWSSAMSVQMREMYPDVLPGSIEVVGSPHFDLHRAAAPLRREQIADQLGIDPTRSYVLVGTGTPSWSPDDHLAVLEFARLVRDELPDLQIVIRTHPKDDMSRWRASSGELEKLGAVFQVTAPSKHMDQGGFQDPIRFFEIQTATIANAAVVLNFASTLTVDAAILDRPVVCVGWDARPDALFPEGRSIRYAHSSHYAPLVATGGVRVARSASEAVAIVARYLDDPGLDAEARRLLVDEVAEHIGEGGVRFGDAVLRLLAR
jgi:hypothetical protein